MYFLEKNSVFGNLQAKKCGKALVFLGGFRTFQAAWGIFNSFDSRHTTPWLGTPLANSWCTMQFLSHPYGL
jgi:hypothetical protein